MNLPTEKKGMLAGLGSEAPTGTRCGMTRQRDTHIILSHSAFFTTNSLGILFPFDMSFNRTHWRPPSVIIVSKPERIHRHVVRMVP